MRGDILMQRNAYNWKHLRNEQVEWGLNAVRWGTRNRFSKTPLGFDLIGCTTLDGWADARDGGHRAAPLRPSPKVPAA